MEARVSKLEAQVESVQAELAKLADLPASLATLTERASHLATKAEMKDALDGAVERLGGRVQRAITVASIIVMFIFAIVTTGVHFLGK